MYPFFKALCKQNIMQMKVKIFFFFPFIHQFFFQVKNFHNHDISHDEFILFDSPVTEINNGVCLGF